MISQAKNSGVNPQDFMKQMMGDVSPEQLQTVFTQAKSMGCGYNNGCGCNNATII